MKPAANLTCRMFATQTSYWVGSRKPWGWVSRGSGESMAAPHCRAIHLPANLFSTPFWLAARTARGSVSVPTAKAAPAHPGIQLDAFASVCNSS